MPWKETCVMDERMLLVARYREGRRPLTEICRDAGISRKTAYKWLARFVAEGAAGMTNRSRAPHVQARQTPEDVVDQIVALKRDHLTWGPKKLVAALRRRTPKVAWPAPSTVSEILDARGLVKRRKRRSRTPPYRHPLLPFEAPNDVWSADFKGQFKTGNGAYCYPLTIADGFSRFLLTCEANGQVSLLHAAWLSASLRGVRAAEGDPHGQRSAVCKPRPGPVPAERLVDEARHPPRADRTRSSGTERLP